MVTYPTSPRVAAAALPPTPGASDEEHAADAEVLNNPISPNDRWTLEHINIAHLQPILEAIDDDGTGFISIKEANTFAVERPKGWT